MDREWIADTRGVGWMQVPENMYARRVAVFLCAFPRGVGRASGISVCDRGPRGQATTT